MCDVRFRGTAESDPKDLEWGEGGGGGKGRGGGGGGKGGKGWRRRGEL